MSEIFAACMGTSAAYVIGQLWQKEEVKFDPLYWIWLVFFASGISRLISYF